MGKATTKNLSAAGPEIGYPLGRDKRESGPKMKRRRRTFEFRGDQEFKRPIPFLDTMIFYFLTPGRLPQNCKMAGKQILQRQ